MVQILQDLGELGAGRRNGPCDSVVAQLPGEAVEVRMEHGRVVELNLQADPLCHGMVGGCSLMPAICDQQIQGCRALPPDLAPDPGLVDRAPLTWIGTEGIQLDPAGGLEPRGDIEKDVVVKLDDGNRQIHFGCNLVESGAGEQAGLEFGLLGAIFVVDRHGPLQVGIAGAALGVGRQPFPDP